MTNKFTGTVEDYLKSVLFSAFIAALVLMTFGFMLNWSYLLCTAIFGASVIFGPYLMDYAYYIYWWVCKRKKE